MKRSFAVVLALCLGLLMAQSTETDSFTDTNGTNLEAHVGEGCSLSPSSCWTDNQEGGGTVLGISGNEMVLESGNFPEYSYTLDQGAGKPAADADYAVQLSCKTDGTGGTGIPLCIRTVWGATFSDDGYCFQLNVSGAATIVRRDNGANTTILTGSSITVPIAIYFPIRIEAESTTLRIFANGKYLGSAADATYSSVGSIGFTGLISMQGWVCDDLLIEEPQGAPSATSVADSASPLQVGGAIPGYGYAEGPVSGSAAWRSGINGPLLADPDFDSSSSLPGPGGAGLDDAGNLWSAVSSAQGSPAIAPMAAKALSASPVAASAVSAKKKN